MNIRFITSKLHHQRSTSMTILLLLFTVSLLISCKSQQTAIPKVLQDYLANQGVQETIVDLDYKDSSIPNKRYVSVSVTYNFSTSDGKPQKEFLGFILKQEGDDWKIDRNTTYTKSETKAKDLLSNQSK